MRRTLIIVLFGLMGGLGAHFGWLTISGPQQAGDMGAQLAWMKGSLRLTDVQLERIKALHEQSAPRLKALATKVEGVREELAAFEREREAEGRIDFLEFARFVEKRRQLDRECVVSTERLVAEAAGVMTPQQREQYFDLLGPALKTMRANASG